jgi:hypothetical protein
MPKYFMTVHYDKPKQCSIYPERNETIIRWHHVLSRPTQALTDDRYNIIGLGDYAHLHKDDLATKGKIYRYQLEHLEGWKEWYLANYKSDKGIIYDVKGYQIFLAIVNV